MTHVQTVVLLVGALILLAILAALGVERFTGPWRFGRRK
jgi:hypothetical protein